MMELQAHHQGGNMPGIQLYGSRCNPYTFSTTKIPRPQILDSLHSRQTNTFTRERFQAWASSSNKPTDQENKMASASLITRPAAQHVAFSSTLPHNNPTNEGAATCAATPAKPRRPFVATAAFPDDIPRLVEIEFAAFQDEVVNHQLSYRDSSNPEHITRTENFYKHCMHHIRATSLAGGSDSSTKLGRADSKLDLTDVGDSDTEGYCFRKVLDPQTHDIIAFCKSEITTLTPEDHASPLDIGHESEPEMNRDWFALNEKLHRSYCGLRQHVYFGMLATHPDHQHRGAATSLMSELIQEADDLGLEIYCEATKTGKPMYEKYGFEAVHTLRFDPAEYGVEGLGVEVQTVMVRGALGKDGVREKVKTWDLAQD